MKNPHWTTKQVPYTCPKCGASTKAHPRRIKQKRPETEMAIDAHNDPSTGLYCDNGQKLVPSGTTEEKQAMSDNYDNYSRSDLLAEIEHHRDRASCANGIIRKTSAELGEVRKQLSASTAALAALAEQVETVFWTSFDGNEQLAATAESLRQDVSEAMAVAYEKAKAILQP